jgi:hypothetical protein
MLRCMSPLLALLYGWQPGLGGSVANDPLADLIRQSRCTCANSLLIWWLHGRSIERI